MIPFCDVNSPLPLKKLIRIWIHLVSGLESYSRSRSKMFIKVQFFIFVLGSMPFIALAEEGKKKLRLKLFPVISCNLTVCVLTHRQYRCSVLLIKLSFEFLSYYWASTMAVIRKETHQKFSDGLSYALLEQNFLCVCVREGERYKQSGKALH